VDILGPSALDVTFCMHIVVLEGGDLSLELLVEQIQFFLFAENVVTFERHLLSLTI